MTVMVNHGFTDLSKLAVGLIAQLVDHFYRYRKVIGSTEVKV